MKQKIKTETENPAASFPVVGIGASAGGLNSFKCFIAELPRKFGFAVVFMQHLSNRHKSLLPGLLHNQRPDIEICGISDGLKILPGKLYLCPPGKEVRIKEGTFWLRSFSGEQPRLPIDTFFDSLAERIGDRAIAVVFSGAGTDGARGIQAIRTNGGTVFIQDPATAEFPEMPLAAIRTGQADGVLSPKDIALEILKLHGEGAAAPDTDSGITPAQFETLSRLLYDKTGYRFNRYKKSVVGRRSRRRMCLRGVNSIEDYIALVAEKDHEAANLASDLMIGVTSFFRDKPAWKALTIGAIRKLSMLDDAPPVRVWTPACATGEEAYSIAMMLRREFELAGSKRGIQVFATDVNDRALERAREGKYPAGIAADVPPDYMKKFFTCSENGLSVVIDKEIRESVVFAKHDVLSDPPFSRLDLIICRNLLIYLEPQAQEKCIALFHYGLRDGGYLFLGNAESVGRNSSLFKSLAHKNCRVYRKIETNSQTRPSFTAPFAPERPQIVPSRALEDQQGVTEFVRQKLLEEGGPAAVAVNQRYDIVYQNSPSKRYLNQTQGAPGRNLLGLLPEKLRSRIMGAIYRASQETKPVLVRAIIPYDNKNSPKSPFSKGRDKGASSSKKGKKGGGALSKEERGDLKTKRQVTLSISRLRDNLFLVIFRDKQGFSKEAGTVTSEAAVIDENAFSRLERDLTTARADLQTNIEQLKSLNEELQSSNEELQTANEELDTSREELQSLNEELITVNAQLQAKVEEQEETNNDLNNFISSTNIPTVFLDTRFRVRRFTPAMSMLLKLVPSDVGRPIIDMPRNNLGPDLMADAKEVLDRLVPIKKETAINGISYIRAVLPYRTSDNRVEGVVITYNDVSDLKRAEERTRHLASFPELNPNPVVEVDSDGKITFYNPATEEILEGLGMDRDDFHVFLPADIGNILMDMEKKESTSFYRELVVKGRVFSETVYLAPQFKVARIYAFDITEQKRTEEANARLAAIIENAEDAIIGKDLEGVIQTWNAGAENIFGYAAEEVIGKNISLLIPPGHGNEVPGIMTKIVRGERVARYETLRMRKDGDIIPVSLTFSPIKDPNGKVVGISKTAHDISIRIETEKALHESERQFRTLADSIPNLAWWANGDGYITWYNRRWYDYTGAAPEQMEGWGWQSVHDPDLLLKVLERWKASIATGEPFEMEFPLRGADGVFRPFLTRVLPLKDSAGRVFRWFGTNTDISALKQAEEALKKSERRYHSLFENMTAAFAYCKMVYDDNNRPVDFIYLDVNGAFREVTGLKNIIGKKATEVIPRIKEAHPELFEIYGRVASTGTPEKFEIEFKPLGVWWSVSAYSMEKEYFVAVFDDITERKQAEGDLLKLSEDMAARNVELESVNKELESFIYSISHDLRAPLRSIAGFVKIVVDDYARLLDVQGQDYLARIHNGAEKMSRLIDDLLYLSKISRQEVRRNKVDISKIASSIVWDLREANPERSVDVRIKEGLAAVADRGLVGIVLSNLIGNAWKFTSKTKDAKIELGATEQDGNTVYYVRDNGAGFDSDYAEKMFWPFHRLHSDKEFPGTGIGLTIAERIIHSHGGRVWAEGKAGKGAAIYFTLG